MTEISPTTILVGFFASPDTLSIESAVSAWSKKYDLRVECFHCSHPDELERRLRTGTVVLHALSFTRGAAAEFLRTCSPALLTRCYGSCEEHAPEQASYWHAKHFICGRGPDSLKWMLRHLTAVLEGTPSSLRYGPASSHTIDVYTPPLALMENPVGVAILHGGFWRAGFGRDMMSGVSARLALSGCYVWNIDYDPGTGGQIDACLRSIEDALAFVARCATTHGITKDNLVLMGHSAGGHLSLLMASRDQPVFGRVWALAPVTDLKAAHADKIGAGAVEQLADKSTPMGELHKKYSPTMNPPRCAVTLVHGLADQTVPAEQSKRYSTSMANDFKISTIMHLLPAANHMDLINENGRHWVKIQEELLSSLVPHSS